jgi:hypothetical protein
VKHENEVNEKDKLQKLLNSNNNVGAENEDEHQQYLQLKYKNYQLEQENKDLKQKLHISSNSDDQRKHAVDSQVDKSFQEQIPVSDDHYKIPINLNIKNKSTNMVKADGSKNIINSVENFQILPQPMGEGQNVLQQPILNPKTSTTTTTTPTPLLKKNLDKISTTTKSSKKLPKFVLPIPDIKNDENVHEESKESPKDDGKKISLDESLNKPPNDEVNENENGAHEINDNNDFNIEEKNPHNHFDSLDQDRNNMLNNAAEEFDGHKKLVNDEMDLEIINRPPNNGNVKDKLKDEIANDHGKEEYPEEDLHIEQQEDDLGDSKLS